MRVSEGQTLGALTFLTVSLIVYGVLFLSARHPVRALSISIPWGDQPTGAMAVEITGDSEREGIYFLPEGTTVGKLRTIGMIPKVRGRDSLEGELIAAGSLLAISERGEVNIREMAASRRLGLGFPIDINRVSEEDLVLVPGIGEKMAHRIVQLRKKKREFQDLSELMAIPGIKEKKLSNLGKYLTIRAARRRI
jgi:competence protein ComEA